MLNTWTPNAPHEASPGPSPSFKYKHFSLLNQFNKSLTNKAAFKTTTSFADTAAGQELSSQFMAIKNSTNSVNLSGTTKQTGFRPAPRTAAVTQNKDRQSSAYARVGVVNALTAKPKTGGAPSFTQIELSNYKNVEHNRIVNKENRQINVPSAGGFSASSVALAGNRFGQTQGGVKGLPIQPVTGVQPRPFGNGTPKKNKSAGGLPQTMEPGRAVRTGIHRSSATATNQRPGSRKGSATNSNERGASLSGTLQKRGTPRAGSGA